MEDLPDYELKELKWFFEDYQDVMRRDVDVEGFQGKDRAHDSIMRCRRLYQEAFPKDR